MKNCKCDFTWGYETIQCHRCKLHQPLLAKSELDAKAKADVEEALGIMMAAEIAFNAITEIEVTK